MDITKKRDLLARLFETQRRADGQEYISFRSDVMERENEAYPVYQAVSTAACESELPHGFSYEITSRAASILSETEHWGDGEAIMLAIDASIPVYNWQLLQIYLEAYSFVDEACQEYGLPADASSVTRANTGWYKLISDILYSIIANLETV